MQFYDGSRYMSAPTWMGMPTNSNFFIHQPEVGPLAQHCGKHTKNPDQKEKREKRIKERRFSDVLHDRPAHHVTGREHRGGISAEADFPQIGAIMRPPGGSLRNHWFYPGPSRFYKRAKNSAKARFDKKEKKRKERYYHSAPPSPPVAGYHVGALIPPYFGFHPPAVFDGPHGVSPHVDACEMTDPFGIFDKKRSLRQGLSRGDVYDGDDKKVSYATTITRSRDGDMLVPPFQSKVDDRVFVYDGHDERLVAIETPFPVPSQPPPAASAASKMAMTGQPVPFYAPIRRLTQPELWSRPDPMVSEAMANFDRHLAEFESAEPENDMLLFNGESQNHVTGGHAFEFEHALSEVAGISLQTQRSEDVKGFKFCTEEDDIAVARSDFSELHLTDEHHQGAVLKECRAVGGLPEEQAAYIQRQDAEPGRVTELERSVKLKTQHTECISRLMEPNRAESADREESDTYQVPDEGKGQDEKEQQQRWLHSGGEAETSGQQDRKHADGDRVVPEKVRLLYGKENGAAATLHIAAAAGEASPGSANPVSGPWVDLRRVTGRTEQISRSAPARPPLPPARVTESAGTGIGTWPAPAAATTGGGVDRPHRRQAPAPPCPLTVNPGFPPVTPGHKKRPAPGVPGQPRGGLYDAAAGPQGVSVPSAAAETHVVICGPSVGYDRAAPELDSPNSGRPHQRALQSRIAELNNNNNNNTKVFGAPFPASGALAVHQYIPASPQPDVAGLPGGVLTGLLTRWRGYQVEAVAATSSASQPATSGEDAKTLVARQTELPETGGTELDIHTPDGTVIAELDEPEVTTGSGNRSAKRMDVSKIAVGGRRNAVKQDVSSAAVSCVQRRSDVSKIRVRPEPEVKDAGSRSKSNPRQISKRTDVSKVRV